MFDDVLLAQSAVDRFKSAAYDVLIDGESYRPRLKPRLKPALDAADPPPPAPANKTRPPHARDDADLRRSSPRPPRLPGWPGPLGGAGAR